MMASVLAHVEVVDHLVDQFRDALDEHFCGIGVGADSQAGQGMGAEGVGRCDSAGVEVGHGSGQPLFGSDSLVAGQRRQTGHHFVLDARARPKGVARLG